jgi:ankyrin repeat protein
MASQEGHAAVVEALLRHPAIKVDQARTDGITPLMIAAYSSQQRCVELLLNAGADRTIVTTGSTFGGKTAVDVAKQQGHESIVALLGGGRQ